jgi:hypothetical protein
MRRLDGTIHGSVTQSHPTSPTISQSVPHSSPFGFFSLFCFALLFL